MDEREFHALMDKARQTNASRDRTDRKYGFATPLDAGDLDRVAAAAVEAGIRTADWNCVAEGLAMLEDLVARRLPRPDRRS